MSTQELWKLYSEDLRTFIISKVKNDSLADDILQDTYLKAHLKSHTIRDDAKVKSWLFSVARNSMMDYFKSQKQKSVLEFEIPDEDPIKNDHDEQDCLRGILKSLPKKYSLPIFLSDIKGLKQSEVAEQLGLPLPTVKSQIQRGRKMITQGFMDCCGFVLNEQGVLVGQVQDKEDCKVCN